MSDWTDWQGRNREPETLADILRDWTWKQWAIAALVVIAFNVVLAVLPH